MMITRFKKIPDFFLFLAASVFYAHMIIPHDHHLAEADVCQENGGPASGNHTTHHKGFPVHCHAFNNLTSEKAIIYIIFGHIQSGSSDPVSKSDLTDFDLTTTWISVFIDFNLAVNSGNLNLSSLRAPPLTS
jgi:hypothetical protein